MVRVVAHISFLASHNETLLTLSFTYIEPVQRTAGLSQVNVPLKLGDISSSSNLVHFLLTVVELRLKILSS